MLPQQLVSAQHDSRPTTEHIITVLPPQVGRHPFAETVREISVREKFEQKAPSQVWPPATT